MGINSFLRATGAVDTVADHVPDGKPARVTIATPYGKVIWLKNISVGPGGNVYDDAEMEAALAAVDGLSEPERLHLQKSIYGLKVAFSGRIV